VIIWIKTEHISDCRKTIWSILFVWCTSYLLRGKTARQGGNEELFWRTWKLILEYLDVRNLALNQQWWRKEGCVSSCLMSINWQANAMERDLLFRWSLVIVVYPLSICAMFVICHNHKVNTRHSEDSRNAFKYRKRFCIKWKGIMHILP